MREPAGASKGSCRGGSSRGGKSRSKASPARRCALETIRLRRERDGFVQDIMARTVDAAPLSPEDRAFATKLVCGVVSRKGTLDELLDSCLDSPRDVRPKVRDALLLSTYEIVFLGKSPHAAVDQGVELVRSVAPRAAGLANAVLRKVVRASEGFPFGDVCTDRTALARSQGFPLWLAEKLLDDQGEEAARGFMEASNEAPPLFVAANAVKASDEEVFALLTEAGAAPVAMTVDGALVAGCYRLANRRALLDERAQEALKDGKLLVADAASQLVAASVAREAHRLRGDPVSGERLSFLEVGAGRATKTILLQSGAVRLDGVQHERHVAVDNVAFKSELLRERAAAYGVAVSDSLIGDATELSALVGDETFSLVFIDSPCTGLGTLRRHPEIRWRISPQNIDDAAALDLRLLRSAAVQLKPSGSLAYATCTVTPEENEGVIDRFLASPEGEAFSIASTMRTNLLPNTGSPDAHFLCILRR